MSSDQKELTAKFAEITALSIDDQSAAFLRAFASEFRGSFEAVLDLAGEFAKYAPKTGVVRELDEVAAHLFLERRGETLTVKELRDFLSEIDLDKNHKVSFIEYLLYKYKKTVTQLFTPPINEARPSPEALEALDEAIRTYQKVVREKNAFEEKVSELTQIISTAKGVAKADAQKALDQCRGDMAIQLTKDKMTAKGAKARAEKAVEESMKHYDPYAAEQERLKKQTEEKAAAEAKAKAESKARLAAKAAQWNK